MHYLKIFFVFLLLSFQLWALDPAKPIDQYLINQWKSSEGLVSDTIISIVQTGDGFLWIASTKGLMRYDGIVFKSVDFIEKVENNGQDNPPPDALWVDKQGFLWIGSSAGLTSYDCNIGVFQTYTSADGMSKDRIRRIRDDLRGDIWVSFFASYLNRLSKGKFTQFNASHGLEGKKINAILEDKKGNLLVGTREYGVFLFRDEGFVSFPVNGLNAVDVIDMVEDSSGVLWIGTSGGLFRISGEDSRHFTTRDGLANDYITSLLEDSDKNLWVGTFKGLHRLKFNQTNSPQFERILDEEVITCLFEDSEKSLWTGINEGGLIRLKESKFDYFEPLNDHTGEVYLSLFEDSKGNLWIGTFDGKLYQVSSEVVKETEVPTDLNGAGITAITEDAQGFLWLGSNGKGVFRRKNNTFYQFTSQDGLTDNLVTAIFCDSRGDLWFSTFDGVSVFRVENNKIESINSQSGLSGKVVHNVYEMNNGDIWIATDKGITCLSGGSMAKEGISFYLAGVDVTCIYEDSSQDTGSVIWIASHGAGFKKLTLSDGKIFSFTTSEGMTSNYIYQFFIDHQDNFWLMSNNGILRVNKSELDSYAAGNSQFINCISYGLSDGLRSPEFDNEFSRHSALKTQNNEYWFVNRGGILVMNPGKILINKVPPPVVIEMVQFDGVPVSFQKTEIMGKGVKEVNIHFTAPSFLSPAKIRFKYRLDGIDREWIHLPLDEPRVVNYTDLKPGAYAFNVTACNAEGVWNPSGAVLNFTFNPRFYETIVFKILMGILFILLIITAFYLYKNWPLKKQEKYKGSSLTPQYADECIKKLKHLMEVERIHCDAEISLQVLADKLSISPHLLSQIINEKLNRNFSDLINFYRIEEAKEILSSPAGVEQKIIAVAFDVGFNTKVAFYNAFKKYTGMTPAEYRKKSDVSKES